MHESSLMTGLLRHITEVARQHQAARIARVDLKVGALLSITPDHLRHHFAEAAHGTPAEGAQVHVRITEELTGLELESVEVGS